MGISVVVTGFVGEACFCVPSVSEGGVDLVLNCAPRVFDGCEKRFVDVGAPLWVGVSVCVDFRRKSGVVVFVGVIVFLFLGCLLGLIEGVCLFMIRRLLGVVRGSLVVIVVVVSVRIMLWIVIRMVVVINEGGVSSVFVGRCDGDSGV